MVLALLVIFQWKIGAVAISLTPSHGIHAGDTLGLGALGGAFRLVRSE